MKKITMIVLCLLISAASVWAGHVNRKGKLWYNDNYSYRLMVKFKPDLDANIKNERLGFDNSEIKEQLSSLIDDENLKFERVIKLSDQEFNTLEEKIERNLKNNSNRDAALGLDGIMYINTDKKSNKYLYDLGTKLERLESVVYADMVIDTPIQPPFDIAPATPDYSTEQGYLQGENSINAEYAWEQGITGQGVSVADGEYDWEIEHEEFNDLNVTKREGFTPAAPEWIDHGTAVAGEIVAGNNGYGVTGCAYGIDEFIGYSEYTVEFGANRPNVIATAASDLDEGDILLLEMQTTKYGDNYGPAELDQAVWDAVYAATQAGLIVVAAAGNGTQDLDSDIYIPYMERGHSGSIIVGAGKGNSSHTPCSFSTYGTRIDLQGWGDWSVFTTGYGDYSTIGNDSLQVYTAGFAGTSSASPIVTSAVALIQSYAKNKLNRTMSGQEIRDLLVETGTPQASGVHIGPLPDVKKAIIRLQDSGIENNLVHDTNIIQSYPNPFNPSARIDYRVENSASLSLKIYNAHGQLVKTLVEGQQNAGMHSIEFNGEELNSGVYYCRLTTENQSVSHKMLLIK